MARQATFNGSSRNFWSRPMVKWSIGFGPGPNPTRPRSSAPSRPCCPDRRRAVCTRVRLGGVSREALLLARVAGQIGGVLIHEGARRGITFVACSIGFTGTFDPQVGVGVRTPGRRGRRSAQCSPARVAPLELGVRRWSNAVARRVDHVVRTNGERRNRLAVTDFVLSGEEVRRVEAETPRATDTDLVEPGHSVNTALRGLIQLTASGGVIERIS